MPREPPCLLPRAAQRLRDGTHDAVQHEVQRAQQLAGQPCVAALCQSGQETKLDQGGGGRRVCHGIGAADLHRESRQGRITADLLQLCRWHGCLEQFVGQQNTQCHHALGAGRPGRRPQEVPIQVRMAAQQFSNIDDPFQRIPLVFAAMQAQHQQQVFTGQPGYLVACHWQGAQPCPGQLRNLGKAPVGRGNAPGEIDTDPFPRHEDEVAVVPDMGSRATERERLERVASVVHQDLPGSDRIAWSHDQVDVQYLPQRDVPVEVLRQRRALVGHGNDARCRQRALQPDQFGKKHQRAKAAGLRDGPQAQLARRVHRVQAGGCERSVQQRHQTVAQRQADQSRVVDSTRKRIG